MTIVEVATRTPDRLRLSLPRQRTRRTGFWVSLAFHGALLALLWTRRDLLVPTPRPGDARFGNIGGGGGGGGGGGAQVATYIIALPPVSPPTTAAPTPVSTPVPPVITPPKAEIPVAQPAPARVAPDTAASAAASAAASVAPGEGTGAVTGSGAGGGSGGGQGTGIGPGAGPGSGTGAGGQGGNIRMPELRGLALPFEKPPKELRGKFITVLFSITAEGRVDHFQTDPVITDRGYYKKFAEAVMGYRFRPARGPDGQPVAVVYPIKFQLPGSE